MANNYINVSVTSKQNQKVSVSTPPSVSEVTATTDTGKFWAQTAEKWATSNTIVENKDYSSKYYANKAKESATNAQSYEQATKESYNAFSGALGKAVNDVQTARDEALTSIESGKNEAVDYINSTKTTILNDIEFVADGEKKEIQDLADEIKDSGDTVNAAIEAGVERLNSIDALKKSQITNCLLEVPQNIKLELNGGALTLKAGSKVIVPNGFEEDGTTAKFDKIVIENDVTLTITGTNNRTICYRPSSNTLYGPTKEESGTTATLNSCAFYNTSENKIFYMDNNIVASSYLMSFPICRISTVDEIITEIKDISNGMGYIGSTVWVDKGVKGLIPNGRNEDGSLNNIEFGTSNVITRTLTGDVNRDAVFGLSPDYIGRLYNTEYSFDYENNYIRNTAATSPWSYCVFATYTDSKGVISNFQPKLPFRAVDYNDISGIKSYITETYVNGTSWYRVYSDGWCEQGGAVTLNGTISSTNVKVTLLKQMKSSNYYCNVTQDANAGGTPRVLNGWHSATSFTVGFVASGGTNGTCRWEVKGYIA